MSACFYKPRQAPKSVFIGCVIYRDQRMMMLLILGKALPADSHIDPFMGTSPICFINNSYVGAGIQRGEATL